MFRFAHPDFLYLLFILPVLIAFYVYAMILKKKAIKKYGNPELLAELMPEVCYCRAAVRLQVGNCNTAGCGDHGLSGRVQLHAGRRCFAQPIG